MHPFVSRPYAAAAGQRARAGLDARDGLEVERESFGRPSEEKPTWQAPFRKSN